MGNLIKLEFIELTPYFETNGTFVLFSSGSIESAINSAQWFSLQVGVSFGELKVAKFWGGSADFGIAIYKNSPEALPENLIYSVVNANLTSIASNLSEFFAQTPEKPELYLLLTPNIAIPAGMKYELTFRQ